MALVVFLRGVNVGGNKAFSPSALAKALARFETINVGAAGTFVLRKPGSQTELRREIARRLPFEAEAMICQGREIMALLAEHGQKALPAETQRFVTVLAKAPASAPKLPIIDPAGAGWIVKVVAISGRYAVSERRRIAQGKYPNEIIEKALRISATTRNWNTLSTLGRILETR